MSDYSIPITAKLTDQIHNQKLDLEYNSSDKQYIRTTKSELTKRTQNAKIPVTNYLEELTPSHNFGRCSGKKGIFLAVSLAKCDQICINKQ